MNGSKELVSIQLFEDGTYKARGVEETKAYLDDEKVEELGIYFDDKEDRYVFGEKSITGRGPYYWNISKNLIMMNPKYESKTKLKGTGYSVIGEDDKGFIYFRKMEGENGTYNEDKTDLNVKFNIAVLDVWNRKVYFYEDYKVNEWNPPRNSEGKVICSTSWTVAPDGNIYFTDCDVANKEWLIKKIPNRWYEEIGINKRHIGTFTKNHIPLYKEPSETAETDGFNFENDIVWEKETKGEWSKIQKLDGREGWGETKYINFDKGK